MKRVPKVTVADVVEVGGPTGGGIRAWIEAKARALGNRGDARHLLVVPGARDQVVRTAAGLRVEIRSPPIPGCPPYRFLLNRRAVARVLARTRPDVVELGSQYRLGRTAREWRDRTGGRLSVFLHTDLAGAYVEPWGRRIFGSRLGEALGGRVQAHMGRLFRAADVALAATPGGIATLEAMGVRGPQLLPLGVELETFHPRRRCALLRRDLLGEERPEGAAPESIPSARLLVFLGRLDGEKRVSLLVDAFTRARAGHPHLHLLLLGDGPLVSRVPRWQELTPGLHHRPWEGSRAEVARILASADAYVTAGPHETFGLSVLEAMACGLPVLGVRAGALAERIDPEFGWLVPADDVEALAQAMGRLAALPHDALRDQGRRARLRALEGNGWDAVFRRLFHLYGLPDPTPAPAPAPPLPRSPGKLAWTR